jgi:type III pantothenate kinase
MILTTDVGNSNIVIGGVLDGKVKFVSRMATDWSRTADEYAIYFREVLSLYEIPKKDFTGSIISSVVPPITSVLALAIKKAIGIEPIIVGPGIKTGLNIQTDNPSQVGADIIMNNVAAKTIYKTAVIVIDMGTATTISTTDQKGNFKGCAIMPGISISLKALSQNTAQLQGINLENPKKAIGTNTIDSMRSGVVYGAAAMCDGIIDRFLDELGCEATIVATGGHSKYIIPYCKKEIIYNENLLLLGLNYIYGGNKK